MKLVITKDEPHPNGSVYSHIVAQLELPDNPEVVAIIMEAAATAVQEHFTWQRERGN